MMDVVPLSALFSIMALSYMRQLFESFLLTRCERFLKPQKAEPVDSSQIHIRWMWLTFFTVIYVLEAHSSHKEIKIHLMI